MKVAVVGAGIHGSSAALSLSMRGHSVTLFEQDQPASLQGSSHGRSRIIRKAYPDAFHAELMLEAYPLWDRLQALTKLPVVHHVGLAYFGSEDSAEIQGVLQSLRELKVELIVDRDSCDLLPSFHLNPGEIAIVTPEAGWVHAENAVQATVTAAKTLGTLLLHQTVESWQELESSFDAVIVTPGAEIGRFVSFDHEVRVQTVAYVDFEARGGAWIEDGPEFLYGFPVAPGERGAKIGVHMRGQVWEPDSARPGPDSESIEIIKDFAHRRWLLEDPQILDTVTCLYTMTPDERFRWGRLGTRTIWCSACSGHGFKFGPWIGEQLADMVEGKCFRENVFTSN